MNFVRIVASTDNIIVGKKRITKVRLVAGSDAATAILFDGTQATGIDFCKLVADAGADTDKENFNHQDGVTLTTSLSVTLSGTNPIFYVYFC